MRSFFLLLLAGCGGLTVTAPSVAINIPQGKLDSIARDVASVGHPVAEYVGSTMVGGSAGLLGGQRYVDVDIRYKPALSKQERTMRVRFNVTATEPCEVTTQVLEDDGPPPVMLDNRVASSAVGEMVCEALKGEEPAK